MLQEQRKQQIDDLQNLEQERQKLQQKAFDMAVKLEDVAEKNDTLLQRYFNLDLDECSDLAGTDRRLYLTSLKLHYLHKKLQLIMKNIVYCRSD